MKILVLGKVWPEPKSSAAGTRMMQLLDEFERFGEVHFATTATKTGYDAELTINTHRISLNDDSFDEWVKALAPDVVVFDRFMTEEQFGWRCMEHVPQAKRILNTEDLHFLRKARERALKQGESIDLHHPETYRELSAIWRCHQTWVVSEFEANLLVETCEIPASMVHYLPLYAIPGKDVPSYEARSGFCFIGNFLHAPNLDALRYLKRDIWPLIRKRLPRATIQVAGAYPTQEVMEMNHPESGFIILGRIDDAATLLVNSRINLAPVRFGAGIKGKLLEGMAYGIPSITTEIGAEGMNSGVWGGVIASNAAEFAAEACNLYTNEVQWNAAVKTGFLLLTERFSQPGFKEKLDASLRDEIRHPHRSMTQAVFQFESALATKYLSRWIIEKNN